MTIGKCKHGEFPLAEGCPQCIADRMGEEGNTEASIAEGIAEANRNIVKVQYYSETTGELSSREYTYFSADRLNVGDVVTVPVRDTTGKAKVSAVDVSAAEIVNFKDKVKTIPSGSIILTKPELEPVPELIGEQLAKEAGISDPAAETALVVAPGADAEAMGYYDEAVKLQEYAVSRVIATVEDVKSANDDLSAISKLKKVMENKRKALLDPLKLQAEAIRETYSTLMDPIFSADKITRDKMIAFDAEQKHIRAEQEEINRKRTEAAEAEMRLKGELTEPVGLVEVSPEAPKKVSTDMGTTGMTDSWKYEVVDFAQLPDEYKVIDGAILTAIARKHHDQKKVPGVRFYNEPFITVRAK